MTSGAGRVDFQSNNRLDEVWDNLEAIAASARTISLDVPGLAAGFLLGESTQQAILAIAEAFLEKLAAPATVAKFVAYDLPAIFVTDLQADLAAISGDADEQVDDKQDATGDTARIHSAQHKNGTEPPVQAPAPGGETKVPRPRADTLLRCRPFLTSEKCRMAALSRQRPAPSSAFPPGQRIFRFTKKGEPGEQDGKIVLEKID